MNPDKQFCAICQDFVLFVQMVMLNCAHLFCQTCLRMQAEVQGPCYHQCPLCRSEQAMFPTPKDGLYILSQVSFSFKIFLILTFCLNFLSSPLHLKIKITEKLYHGNLTA